MKIFKQSTRIKPKISLILLDWSVRESFHLLHYLSLQNIPREQFEVVIIEYYSRRSEAIQKFEDQVDTWVALEMPEGLYYHKHLMYNAGIVASRGEIFIICDSDAMAKPTFLETVIHAFEKEPELILHLDQFRNNRKDLYPFCYPSFEEVTGPGCINIKDGKTTGLAVTEDLIHNRNYGACFCAKREDLIKIGGADEHIDFIGHICGPYDFTFRLMNIGKKEVWHESEFLYHTWHPGQAGENNYLGPHDGRHVSTTSLEALSSNRVQPHVINPAIAKLQKDSTLQLKDLEKDLILPEYEKIAKMSFLMSPKCRKWAEETYQFIPYRGYVIEKEMGKYYAIPACFHGLKLNLDEINSLRLSGDNLSHIKQKIDTFSNIKTKLSTKIIFSYFFYRTIRRILGKIKYKLFLKIFLLKTIKFCKKIYRLFAYPRRKFKDLRKEGLYFEKDIYSLILNLHNYRKNMPNDNVILLVSSLLEYKFYKFFIKMKLIPNVSMVLINELDQDCPLEGILFASQQTYIQNLDVFLNNQIQPIVV